MSDTFSSILGTENSSTNLDTIKHLYITKFPQSIDEKSAIIDDPGKDLAFLEPLIDQLRAQKNEDLDRYRKDLEKRHRQWGDEFDSSLRVN